MSNIVLAAGILRDHPTAVAWSEVVTAVVAGVSFLWASHYARPTGRKRSKRINVVEGIGKAQWVCNPGRRSSDRCSACPLDTTCVKHLPPLTESERNRDRAAVMAVTPAEVVFVDDNDSLRMVLKVVLNDAGINVRLASGLEDALPFSPGERLLITDWRLTDGTGGEVIRAFRETDHDRAVLIVSALEKPPVDAPPSVRWISKPFDPELLVAEVQIALRS